MAQLWQPEISDTVRKLDVTVLSLNKQVIDISVIIPIQAASGTPVPK